MGNKVSVSGNVGTAN